MLAAALPLLCPALARDPAATAGGSAYSALSSTELIYIHLWPSKCQKTQARGFI